MCENLELWHCKHTLHQFVLRGCSPLCSLHYSAALPADTDLSVRLILANPRRVTPFAFEEMIDYFLEIAPPLRQLSATTSRLQFIFMLKEL